MWLERGKIVQNSETTEVIINYLKRERVNSTWKVWNDLGEAPGNGKAKLKSVKMLNLNNQDVDTVNIENPVIVEVEYVVTKTDTVLNLSISLYDQKEIHVFTSPSMTDSNWYLKKHPAGVFKSRCVIQGNLLNQGSYSLSVLLVEDGAYIIGNADRVVSFDVFDSGSKRGAFFGTWGGVVRPNLDWNTEFASVC